MLILFKIFNICLDRKVKIKAKAVKKQTDIFSFLYCRFVLWHTRQNKKELGSVIGRKKHIHPSPTCNFKTVGTN